MLLQLFPLFVCTHARATTPHIGNFIHYPAGAARLCPGHTCVVWALYTDPPQTRGRRIPHRPCTPLRLSMDPGASHPLSSVHSSPTHHGSRGFASVVQVPFADLATDSGGLTSLVVRALYTDFAMDSGASHPPSSWHSTPTHHGLEGFASPVVRVPYADFITDSGASPPSSSGCPSPTSLRTVTPGISIQNSKRLHVR